MVRWQQPFHVLRGRRYNFFPKKLKIFFFFFPNQRFADPVPASSNGPAGPRTAQIKLTCAESFTMSDFQQAEGVGPDGNIWEGRGRQRGRRQKEAEGDKEAEGVDRA